MMVEVMGVVLAACSIRASLLARARARVCVRSCGDGAQQTVTLEAVRVISWAMNGVCVCVCVA